MRLMVFDLDTALCQASAMDGLAMASAIQEITDRHLDPQTIQTNSDLKTIWYQATGTLPSVKELITLRDRFAFHLRRQFIIRPSVVSANYPMIEAVNRLQGRTDTLVGVVTAMPESVLLLKARAIGLLCDTLPVATGDDADHFDGLLKTLHVRVRRGFGFNYDQAQLIAGLEWTGAASRLNMSLLTPEEFITDNVLPPRTNLFERNSARA